MSKYTLPAEQPAHSAEVAERVGGENTYPDAYDRSVRLPVNDEILDSVEVGTEVQVILQGTVTELTKRDSSEGYTKRSIEVKFVAVEVQLEDDEKAEKDFKKGFKRGPTK